MTIRLETSKGTGVRNYQTRQVTTHLPQVNRLLQSQFPNAKPRTPPSGTYNCHGLTFASRRTTVYAAADVALILKEDEYKEVPPNDVKPGDIAVYSDQGGDLNHSGIVVDVSIAPVICSKWGSGGEFIHSVSDCPSIYGPNVKFYRCAL